MFQSFKVSKTLNDDTSKLMSRSTNLETLKL